MGCSSRNSVAISDSPLGPFKDIENEPLLDLGYAVIDPNVFIDEDGRKYLYYIKDCSENVVNGRHESHVYGVELNDDMISAKGEPILLAKPEQAWEMGSGPEWLWNEGSTVFKRNGIYYMTYSANYFSSKDYSIGYATSKSPLGPFVKYENNPIVQAEAKWDDISGPGHNSITISPDGKEFIMVYHTHTVPIIGGSDRQVCIDRIGFREDGTMYVNGPTISEQLVPWGVDKIKNIALEAEVKVSKTEDGYSKEYINDGSIGLYSRLEKNEWVNTDKDSWVEMKWEKEKSIQSIMIYGSVKHTRNIENGKIVFSNGKVINDVIIPNRPGEAAIYNFETMDIEWIKLIIKNDKEKENAISEIMVLGN